MSDHHFFTSLAKVGEVLGKGLVAGLAGTLAITASQMIEMQITNREMSKAPAKVGGKTLGVEPRGEAELEKEQAEPGKPPADLQQKVENNQEKFSQVMHFGYGTSWGVARSVLDAAGLQGLPASLAHFVAIWGTAQVMLPLNDASKPITEWSAQQIAIDVLHHGVYALAAGAVYDAMKQAEVQEKRWRLF